MLIDKIAFLAGFGAGAQLPKFMADQRQWLAGRLEQARLDLAAFQDIAERFHGGSLEALAEHHLASTDATFHAEGVVIQRLAAQAEELAQAQRALYGGLHEQFGWLVTHFDLSHAQTAWQHYRFGVEFTSDALIAGLIAAFAASLLLHGLGLLLRRVWRWRSESRRAVRGA